LTYVLAFSKDEVQDVTWRYTARFSDVLTRRKECSEGALLKWILDITKYLLVEWTDDSFDEVRTTVIQYFLVVSQADFVTARKKKISIRTPHGGMRRVFDATAFRQGVRWKIVRFVTMAS
jgi:peptide-N4-(N-acetyl-beta-glucosaminyl)asparagine amidase